MEKHKLTTLIKPETYEALAAQHGSRGIGHAIDELVRLPRKQTSESRIEQKLDRLIAIMEALGGATVKE